MADNVQWIKMKIGMFDGSSFKKIKRAKIGGVPFRDKLTAVWFELLELAGKSNYNGCLVDNNEIPYQCFEDIACMLDRDEKEIELCIQFFIAEKMMEIIDDVYKLSNFCKYQCIDGLDKIRERKRLAQAKWRENAKLKIGAKIESNVDNLVDTTVDTTQGLLSISISISTISNIFNYWNNKDIIKHREISPDLQKNIEVALKKYGEETLYIYIDRYSEVLHSKYFFNYKWTLSDFLKRKDGIESFTNEGSKWNNYLVWKNETMKNQGNEELLSDLFDKTWGIVLNKDGYEGAKAYYMTLFAQNGEEQDIIFKARNICKLYNLHIVKWNEQNTEMQYIPNFKNWLINNIPKE